MNNVVALMVHIVSKFPYTAPVVESQPDAIQYVVVSEMLPDAMDCPVVESVIDTRAYSSEDGARGESPPALGMSKQGVRESEAPRRGRRPSLWASDARVH